MSRTLFVTVTFLLIVAAAIGFAVARFTQSEGSMASAEMEPTISYWVAPMDRNYRRDGPGKSPMGMDLIPVYEDENKQDSAEPTIAYWVAPMDRNYRRDGPGQSPMGMDLIPVYEDDNGQGDGDVPSLRINPAVVNNIGVRVAEVVRGTLYRQIKAVGFVTPNEENMGHVHIRASGWIEELNVRSVGEVVSAGDILFRFYSPDIVSAQAEYLQTRRRGTRNLIVAARERLIALGVTTEQIKSIRETGRVQRLVEVRAHKAGTVLELGVREGKYVVPDDMIMNMADLSSVWVLVDVFEDEAAWVEPGQTANMRLAFAPGIAWKGVVDYVYPTVDAVSRTVRARIVFDNPDRVLKPDMYADLIIDTDPKVGALTIPQSALIRASSSDRVILALGEGRFRPARVVAGIESGDRVQILSGLVAGERVVVSGQFLIDSEASLDAALLRLTAPDAPEEQQAHDEHRAHGEHQSPGDHEDHEADQDHGAHQDHGEHQPDENQSHGDHQMHGDLQ